MLDSISYHFVQIAREVDKVCNLFLEPRGFSHFQFKRTFKEGSVIILANRPDFFEDLLEKTFTEASFYEANNIHQSSIYFWDEFLSPSILSLTREKMGIYHGITIMSRRKIFFDCTSFAMSKPHPSPSSFYLHKLKELQNFSELFPKKAHDIIKRMKLEHTQLLTQNQTLNRKEMFLPKRSSRFRIGKGVNDYVTTYEALCVQLLQDGKSYKEIGSILSMAPRTVETHLDRLKKRTGLTYQELSIRSLQPYGHKKKGNNDIR